MRTNRDRLVMVSVQGEVSHPDVWSGSYDVGFDGVARLLPGTGGIVYNVRVGDPRIWTFLPSPPEVGLSAGAAAPPPSQPQ